MTSSSISATKKTLRLVASACWVVVICVALILLDIFPHRPTSILGWLILLLIGVPLYLALVELGGFVFSGQRGCAISPARFSVKRVLFGLAFFILYLAVLYGIWLLVGPYISEYFS